MKQLLFLLSILLLSSDLLFAQHTVPVPDCDEPGFSVLAKRHNREPRDWTPMPSRVVCQLPGFDMTETFVAKNIYGSRTDKQVEATGFFRTEKIDGRWWIVDPQGYLQINVGVCAVNKNSSTRNKAALAAKYNNSGTEWMRATKDSLKHYGFYAATAWTDRSNILVDKETNPMGYTPIYNFATTYASRRRDTSYDRYGYGNASYSNVSGINLHVFDPEFAAFCDHFAKTNCRPLENDPDIIGFFSDNELTFSAHTLLKYLQVSDKTYPGYLAAKDFVESKNFTVSDVIAGKTTAGATITLSRLKEDWFYVLTAKYYSTVRAAIKKYAPNHMYIGSRLHIPSLDYEGIVKAAVDNLDIISFNTYNVWYTSKEKADFWATRGDRPFLVTEFYAKGEDVFMTTGEKFPNTSGVGYIVYTQKERGYYYQTFCLGLLEAKNCVGWHHFKYMDNDPEDPGDSDPSNVDSNKGLVSNDYDYYTGMMNETKTLNDRIYNLVDYFDKGSTSVTPVEPVSVIYPEADANYRNALNEGTSENLAVKEADPYRQSIVRFDISTLPSNFAWTGFRLEGTRTITDPQTNVYAIDVVNDNSWSETGIVRSNMPVSSYIGIHTWSTNTGTVANVTNYVKEALSKNQTKISFKVRVSTQGTPDYMSFGSRENPDANKRPKLEYAMQVTAGLENQVLNNDIFCYPNPTTGNFHIEFNNTISSPLTINIYNSQGQLYKTVYDNASGSEKTIIPLTINEKGIYFIRAIQNNPETKTVKLIVN